MAKEHALGTENCACTSVVMEPASRKSVLLPMMQRTVTESDRIGTVNGVRMVRIRKQPSTRNIEYPSHTRTHKTKCTYPTTTTAITTTFFRSPQLQVSSHWSQPPTSTIFTHTHTYTHTHIHTHTHTNIHTNTHKHTHIHTLRLCAIVHLPASACAWPGCAEEAPPLRGRNGGGMCWTG